MLFYVKPQHESTTGIHISPPFWTSFPSPTSSHPSTLIQSPCLSFLSCTANSYWLSTLHMVIKFPCYCFLMSHPLLSSPLPISISLFCMSVSPFFSSVAQSSPPFCDSMNHSMPGLPVHHRLPEFIQTHIHWSVMPSNYLILCRPLLLLPLILPNIRVFSNESVLRIR